KNDGLMGNIYSMGVAMQALEAIEKFYAPREWDCEQAFNVVYQHDYQLTMAIAQVLPALVDKPYIRAGSLASLQGRGSCPGHPPSSSPLPETIQVLYSIINKLKGKHFHYSITVSIPDGSTLLKVMQVAAEKEGENFSFKTEDTSWGPMVVSIHGVAADDQDRTYWQFFSGDVRLQEGVGTYKPQNGEHIRAVFSRY
ncbi:IF factor, partial [Brachypteracias leptosomus]|nr:IF factor [Brachypteracias leptosomus]